MKYRPPLVVARGMPAPPAGQLRGGEPEREAMCHEEEPRASPPLAAAAPGASDRSGAASPRGTYARRRARRGGRPWLLRVATAAWRARLEELQRAASVASGRVAEVQGDSLPLD